MSRAVTLALAIALIAGGACGGSGTSGGSDRQEIHVTIRDSRFLPDHFEFEAGTTVTFVVENTDPIDHEFLIGDEAEQQAHEDGTEPHHGSEPGEISIPIGETRTTTYTFTEPGKLLIGCHLPTHYEYGMRGDIIVTR